MIVGERKSFEELQRMLDPYEKVLMVGCGMCVWRCPNHNLEIKQTSEEPV